MALRIAVKPVVYRASNEAGLMWNRFFQAEEHWALLPYRRYDPGSDDPPTGGVSIEWDIAYPEGRLVVWGEACADFLRWLQETHGRDLDDAIACYMPELQQPNVLDALTRGAPELQQSNVLDIIAYLIDYDDPSKVSYVLPFTRTYCPPSLMCLFEQKTGWVYFLAEEGGSHFLKIGYCTVSPQQRMAGMRQGNHRRLSLVRAFPCHPLRAPKYEKFLHKLFSDHRQGRTEWFDIDRETAEKGYRLAVQQGGDLRYFWTDEQWQRYEEAYEEYAGEYYEQYPWEDPDRAWALEE